MKGFLDNIEELTKENDNFREVVFTGEYSQLVLMSLKPGEEIGLEAHEGLDQFFRIDEGKGEMVIDGERKEIGDGFAVVVPAGSEHNLINIGDKSLKLYTVYSPPNHPDGTVHESYEEAMEYEKREHGE